MINHLAGDAPVSRKGAQAGQPGLSEFHSENSLSMATFLDSFQVRPPFHSAPPFTTQWFFPSICLDIQLRSSFFGWRTVSSRRTARRCGWILSSSYRSIPNCFVFSTSHHPTPLIPSPRWIQLLGGQSSYFRLFFFLNQGKTLSAIYVEVPKSTSSPYIPRAAKRAILSSRVSSKSFCFALQSSTHHFSSLRCPEPPRSLHWLWKASEPGSWHFIIYHLWGMCFELYSLRLSPLYCSDVPANVSLIAHQRSILHSARRCVRLHLFLHHLPTTNPLALRCAADNIWRTDYEMPIGCTIPPKLVHYWAVPPVAIHLNHSKP